MKSPHDHFLRLCNLWCEQQISVEQLEELQTLLRSNAVLLEVFVEFIQLHGQLAWDAGVVAGSALAETTHDDAESSPVEIQIESTGYVRGSRYHLSLPVLAAGLLLLIGIVTFNLRSREDSRVTTSKKPPVPQSSDKPDNSPDEQPLLAPDLNVAVKTENDRLKPLELNGMKSTDVSSNAEAVIPDVDATVESLVVKLTDDASIVSEIDRRIAEVWSDYNIIPAEHADDHEWVRRCYLTLTGRIPTISEASAFVDLASPRKRAALIDSLLKDPHFAENFSVTWTNLLIGRSNARNVDAGALYEFLNKQFLNNRSWMETVGDLIAAEGRSDQNGATNFLLAHLNDQATPATAVTARLFLGQQVQCTQCHDHPFAKDRHQDEFWSLNAFFKQAERRQLPVTTVDGNSSNIWTLSDSGSPGMTFYDTRRGQQKATLPEFNGHAMSANDTHPRRAELVRLLEADSRQLVAQAMINRTWAQVFGYGFTNPIDDMGAHNPVSNPELLKFLSESFAASNYDVQRLMRWLTLSQAFQLSSIQDESSSAMDNPQDGGVPLFSRAYPRPMAPEQVYDSIRIAIRSAANQPIDSSIGSVHRREWVGQFVQSYGTDENDEHLAFEGNIAQAMLMMNGEDLQSAIPLTANEVTKSVQQDTEPVKTSLNRIAMATLNREPSSYEEKIFRKRFRSLIRSQSQDQAIRTATEDMLWAYLNSSEFTSLH
jgi:hypothetical protein